jgi:hypothetical protein
MSHRAIAVGSEYDQHAFHPVARCFTRQLRSSSGGSLCASLNDVAAWWTPAPGHELVHAWVPIPSTANNAAAGSGWRGILTRPDQKLDPAADERGLKRCGYTANVSPVEKRRH